jgi:isoquinoline 1-oxidoreductase subunit beta
MSLFAPPALSRRRFLTSAVSAGALLVGFHVDPSGLQRALAQTTAGPAASAATNWLSLDQKGNITLISAKVEMGQGAFTAWAMTVAEELNVPVASIQIQVAPADPMRYRDPLFKKQATWGSTGIQSFFDTLTSAAIAMRESLVLAAAARWQVDSSLCRTEGGYVWHTGSTRKLAYGELAMAATTILHNTPMTQTKARAQESTRLIGKPVRRIDSSAKVNGSAKFGLDVMLPGMKTVLIVRPPQIGATLKSFDIDSIRPFTGVTDVQPTSIGVAVIADDFWSAKQAKAALKVDWLAPLQPHPDSEALETTYRKRLADGGVLVASAGKANEVFVANNMQVVRAEYYAPFMAHAAMEPLNCTAHFHSDQLHIWVGTQDQEATLEAAMAISKLPLDKIHIHTELLGGGFGRRAATDFVRPAVEIAMRVQYPVKVVFERADDIQGFFYRPASLTLLEAALTSEGKIDATRIKVVCSSIMEHFSREHVKVPDGEYDFFAVQSLATSIYNVANRETRWVRHETGIPAWIWRGVGLSQNLFFLESFIDELAYTARQNPVEFRLNQLPATPNGERMRRVLRMATDKAGWGKLNANSAKKSHRAHGVAIHAYLNVFMALIAEVSIENNRPRVHRVTFVCDCGRVVNPNIVRQQLEGGVIMGLSMLQSGGISIKDGAVMQSNFHDFPVARMSDAPVIECHLIEGSTRVTGMGEFTNTTMAPAVANAMFALTGKRIRRFPLQMES